MNNVNKYICKCCGNEVVVSIKNFENRYKNKNINEYECKCEAWKEIINAKNKIEEINRDLLRVHKKYNDDFSKIKENIKNKYNVDLSEYVWYKKIENIKK